MVWTPFSVYLGWVTVAFLANTYAWLADAGVDVVTRIQMGVVGIVVAAAIAVATVLLSGGRVAPALATSWGLAWVAAGRTEGAFESPELVWTAVFALVVVLAVALVALRQRRAAERTAA